MWKQAAAHPASAFWLRGGELCVRLHRDLAVCVGLVRLPARWEAGHARCSLRVGWTHRAAGDAKRCPLFCLLGGGTWGLVPGFGCEAIQVVDKLAVLNRQFALELLVALHHCAGAVDITEVAMMEVEHCDVSNGAF